MLSLIQGGKYSEDKYILSGALQIRANIPNKKEKLRSQSAEDPEDRPQNQGIFLL